MENPPPLAPAADTQRCIITGKTFPKSQMIETEHGWVSLEARDTYYQCLRENVPFPTAEGMTNARSDGKRIIVPTNNPVLPPRCVKTNQPITAAELKKKTLYWCPPWALIMILLNLLIFLIVYLIVRKKVVVMVPVSAAGRRLVRKHVMIATVSAVGGLGLFIVGIANTDGRLIIPGIIALLGGLLYGGRKGTLLRVVKYNSVETALAGACPEFLASLPPYSRK
jgi:hypothetical protein